MSLWNSPFLAPAVVVVAFLLGFAVLGVAEWVARKIRGGKP